MASISNAGRDDSTSVGLACDDLAAGTATYACRTMVEGFRVPSELISSQKYGTAVFTKDAPTPMPTPMPTPTVPSCSRRLGFALTALRAEFDSYCVPKKNIF